MNPIISPMFIYVLSVVDSFIGLLWGSICLLIIILIFSPFIADKCTETYEEGAALFKKIVKRCIVGIIIISIGLVFIPNKETLMIMYASKYVTVDNIKLGKEAVIDTIKDIVEIIDKKEKED